MTTRSDFWRRLSRLARRPSLWRSGLVIGSEHNLWSLTVKLFKRFKEKFRHEPENRVAEVTCGADAVELRWPKGPNETVRWSDVQGIVIRTTDKGPFDEDVFFVLEAGKDTFVIPQEADGVTDLVERIQQLPGFNNEALIESMGCTERKLFLCWERRPVT